MTKQEMRPIDANRLNAVLKNIQERTEADKAVMASSLSVFLDYAMEIVDAQPTIVPLPKCYSEDVGGGCRYLVPDGDDEPIAKCKRCPLCYVDKSRHQSPPNEPLTLEELREMDGEPVWIVESPEWGHWELSEDAEDYLMDREEAFYGMTYEGPGARCGLHPLGWLAYRRKPEGGNRWG